MNDKKLKPEHRKLWRRVYFYEFEELRHTAEDSANMADRVVAQWEARGAFDDVPESLPSSTTTPAALVPHSHAKLRALVSGDGFHVFSGDALHFGMHGRAVVAWTARSVSNCITFDVVVESGQLMPGDKVVFRDPRPGIAADAVVVTG